MDVIIHANDNEGTKINHSLSGSCDFQFGFLLLTTKYTQLLFRIMTSGSTSIDNIQN